MTYVNHKVLNYSLFYDPELSPYLNPATDRRVVVLTGANSGIGWYTALHLYLHGYVIYIFGRSDERVMRAIEDIQDEAEKRMNEYSEMEKTLRWYGELHYIHIDLSDLRTVGVAVYQFSLRESQLHILICNAGVMGIPFELTEDAFEIQYQVNYVSHFLLTMKLLQFMKHVVNEGIIQPRIILLSSFSHKFVYKRFEPGSMVNKMPSYIFTWVRYGLSKLAMIQFAKMLNKNYPKILSVSVHPGFVLNTALYNHWRELKFVGLFAKGLFSAGNSTIGVTNEEGALASLRAALDTGLTAKLDGGKYYVTGGQEAFPSVEGSNMTAAQKLWDWTVKELEKRSYSIPEAVPMKSKKKRRRRRRRLDVETMEEEESKVSSI